MGEPKLFAVYLGGRADYCNFELFRNPEQLKLKALFKIPF